MRLVAVGHLAFGSFGASLCCMAAFEAVEAQPFCGQSLNSLLDVGVGENVAEAHLMHTAAYSTNVVQLLFWR